MSRVKYLGVFIFNDLKWASHISSVPSKFSPSAKMSEIVRTFYTQCKDAENFSSFLSGFSVISKKKKKVITPMEASFSPILC